MSIKQCEICYDPIDDGGAPPPSGDAPLGSTTALTTLKCGHIFHSDCINQWLTKQYICPYCKATVKAHVKPTKTAKVADPVMVAKISLHHATKCMLDTAQNAAKAELDKQIAANRASAHPTEENFKAAAKCEALFIKAAQQTAKYMKKAVAAEKVLADLQAAAPTGAAPPPSASTAPPPSTAAPAPPPGKCCIKMSADGSTVTPCANYGIREQTINGQIYRLCRTHDQVIKTVVIKCKHPINFGEPFTQIKYKCKAVTVKGAPCPYYSYYQYDGYCGKHANLAPGPVAAPPPSGQA